MALQYSRRGLYGGARRFYGTAVSVPALWTTLLSGATLSGRDLISDGFSHGRGDAIPAKKNFELSFVQEISTQDGSFSLNDDTLTTDYHTHLIAMRLNVTGEVVIYEDDIIVYTIPSSIDGDVIKIKYEDGTLSYLHNESTVHTSVYTVPDVDLYPHATHFSAGKILREATSVESLLSTPVTSEIWGVDGSLWDDTSATNRLPDFSYMGYHAGDMGPPPLGVKRDVTLPPYNADNTGVADTSAAILSAWGDLVAGEVLWFPDGTYLLQELLELEEKGDCGVQGESRDGTIIYIDKSGWDLGRADLDAGVLSWWYFEGAFIWVKGTNQATVGTNLANITAARTRNQTLLSLDRPIGKSVGDWIVVVAYDPASGPNQGDMQRHIYDTVSYTESSLLLGEDLLFFPSRIAGFSGDDDIILERKLPINLEVEWTPEVHDFVPTVEDFYLRDLTIQFDHTAFEGHLSQTSPGRNAIQFSGVVNSYVGNIKIIDADYGVHFNGNTCFTTIDGITFEETASRGEYHGHHAFSLGTAQDCLVTNFHLNNVSHVHDLTVVNKARGNGYVSGDGLNINMDHHRRAPYQNLYSDIDLGIADRAFVSSGGADIGPHAGQYNTYWNLRGTGIFDTAVCSFGGGHLNFVAVNSSSDCAAQDWFINDRFIDPAVISPPEIQAAMFANLPHPTYGTSNLIFNGIDLNTVAKINGYPVASIAKINGLTI